MSVSTAIHLVGISGSLRKASHTSAVLGTLAELLPDGVTLEILKLNSLVLYDQDLDTQTPPPSVSELRAAIASADGIIVGTPEYNYGISGVLKNALDWASRPYGKAALAGKPVLTFSASPSAIGGARAQSQLNETLTAIAAHTVRRPQTVIGLVHEKVAAGRLVDAATRDFLQAGIEDLVRDIRRAGAAIRRES